MGFWGMPKKDYKKERGLKDLDEIQSKIGICEVIWLNELKINETMHISPPSDYIKSLLQRATKAEEVYAIDWYKEILKEDPQHFLANLKLGTIIYKYQIELTQRAESKGKELNRHMKLESANNLAYFYGELYRREKEKSYLDSAIKLCEQIEKEYKRIRVEQYSAFLDTYGFLLTQRKKSDDFEKAHKLLKEAEEIAPNQNIHRHLAELYEEAPELLKTSRED